MKKNGFTLIELLAVIVVLAIIVLLAVTAAVPMMNRAKKSSLADEALAYIRAAKQAYTVENMDGQTSACYDISYLNEKYIMKEDNNYKGMVIVSGPINDINFSISLSNGKFYVVKSNASKVTISDVSNSKPNGYAASCGSYNPVLSNEVNTNSLVYKLIMANGKSTLEANLNDINNKTADFNNAATTAADSGLFKAEDDDGASYYYRGVVNNNWVSFAGFYWRIIRINGDGSIRMIYTGTASSNHTGANAAIKNTYYADATLYSTTTTDVTGLTNAQITTTYRTGRFANTYVGYMYNPIKVLGSSPSYGLSTSKKLNYFPVFAEMESTRQYYLFKNFNPSTDCVNNNGADNTSVCTLKCAKLGDDCIQTTWSNQASNTSNYSTTADGAISSEYVYTSPYKYTCWGLAAAVTRSNSNSTTSVYISCPVVSEILGVIPDQATKARVRFHGLFSPSVEASNSNLVNSTAKIELEAWYQSNIYNKKDSFNKYYEEYLADGIFCNDRSTVSTQVFPINNQNSYTYAPDYRILHTKSPSLKCPNKGNDGFTLANSSTPSIVTPKNNGNNMLKYPVGLITADELAFAGGVNSSSKLNTSFYLYTGDLYWTMSPYVFYSSNASAYMWYFTSSGYIEHNYYTVGSAGARPVINLSSDVLFNSGNGTEASPYTVKLQ